MMKKEMMILLICVMSILLCSCKNRSSVEEKSAGKNSYQEYIQLVQQYEKDKTDCKYDLIYFNADDIPELVAGVPGSFVALYSLDETGKIHTIMDDWPYGAFGNAGYEVLEKEGLIRNYNSDYAGLVVTTSLIKVKDNYQQEMYSSILMPEEIKEEEIDQEMKKDAEEYLKEFGGYYFNDKLITKEEFLAQVPEKEFELLYGEMSASEIIEELTDLER